MVTRRARSHLNLSRSQQQKCEAGSGGVHRSPTPTRGEIETGKEKRTDGYRRRRRDGAWRTSSGCCEARRTVVEVVAW
ncbi:hypothetical protein ABZP36_017782 [Zizania latifolia]